ncbi:uncharacterized protein LOC143688295 isoform X2 [Tamandua tetradactyla]|uniref:uncharacterized protein LOC143688295 isoform X2 n=1 Tax=Tamandua tetradactyla TaxID=48850 RepID=UPI0040540ED0
MAGCWQCNWLLAVINGSISVHPRSWSMCPDPLGTSGHAFFSNSSLAPLGITHCKKELYKHLERLLNGPICGIQVGTGIQGTPAGSTCVDQNEHCREPNCTEVPCLGPTGVHIAYLVNRMPFRGSWMLCPSQKPMIRMLLPLNPKENSQEEPVVHKGPPQVTMESKFKVKPLEGEDDSPAVPTPSSLDASPLAPEQPRILEAITHLGPLGVVLANPPLSPRGFQRTLLLQACLQLPPCSPSRFVINRGQFRQDGVTSIRARPQASINLYMKKSPLSHARTIPEAREAIQGFDLIENEKFCPFHF